MTTKRIRKRSHEDSEWTQMHEDFCLKIVFGAMTIIDAYMDTFGKQKKDIKLQVKRNYASDVMRRDDIKQRIKEMRSIVVQNKTADLEQILTEMTKWVLFDPIDLVDENGSVKSMAELPEHVRKTLSSPIRVEEIWEGAGENRKLVGYLKEVRFIDKRLTADMFLKKFGAYLINEIENKDLDHIRDVLRGVVGINEALLKDQKPN